MPKRYVVCGLSSRGLNMFVLPLLGGGDGVEDQSMHGTLVAIVDNDAERVAAFNATRPEAVLFYQPEDFARMIDEVAPDAVIVAGPDHTHVEYILAALARDIDVITEKPMVTTAADAAAVLAAEQASRASVLVTHNLRYTGRHRQIKQMLRDGLVGRITHVELAYHVDTVHGASYFYRWNRQRALSGGLSVHKSCHHFDLVNWWLEDVPQQVFAYGGLNYYGPDSPYNPSRRDGLAYSVPEQKARNPYHQRWAATEDLPEDDHRTPRVGAYGLPYPAQYPPSKPLYIFDEEIDIEDTYTSLVRYRGGASLAYTIDFSSPWSGYRLAINGTHGRIEASYGFLRGVGELPDTHTITYYPLFGPRQVHDVNETAGGHDGADPLVRHDVFAGPSHQSVELGLVASSLEGAYAVALGEGVWRSVTDNRPYDVAELLGL